MAAPHPQGGGGNGPGAAFFNQLAGNGVFLTFIALSTLLVLVLPLVVAVVAGDSIAGEAGYGTLRYLLAVPGRADQAARREVRRHRRVRAVRDCYRVARPRWSSARCCSRSGR